MNGLNEFTGFLKGQQAYVDFNSGIGVTQTFYMLIGLILVITGFIMMGVYLLRFVCAIVVIALGLNTGNDLGKSKIGTATASFVKKWAPGNADSSTTVMDYVKSNIMELTTTFIAIYLVISGTLWVIVAFIMTGLGYVANKVLNLDLASYESAIDSQAYVNNVPTRKTQDLAQEYNSELPKIRSNIEHLYTMQGATDADTEFATFKSNYTRAMIRADVISKELNKRQAAVKELGLPADSFNKHKQQTGSNAICNSAFFSEDIMVRYGVTLSCSA